MADGDAPPQALPPGADHDGFAGAYGRHADAVYSLALAIGRDPQLAADVTRETLLAATIRLGDVDPERVRPWLLAAARSRVAEALRVRRAAARTAAHAAVSGTALDGGHDGRHDGGHDGRLTAGQDGLHDGGPSRGQGGGHDGWDGARDGAVAAAPEDGHRPGRARGAEAAEVEELLSDPAAGLDERDRAVLHLSRRQELRGAALAEALGVAPGTVQEMLERARRRLEGSVGALLVARRGRDECPELDALLAGWDGRFTPLWRARVARHVDGCRRCTRTRDRLLPPVVSGVVLPLVVAPEAVRAALADTAPALADAGPALADAALAGASSTFGGAPSTLAGAAPALSGGAAPAPGGLAGAAGAPGPGLVAPAGGDGVLAGAGEAGGGAAGGTPAGGLLASPVAAVAAGVGAVALVVALAVGADRAGDRWAAEADLAVPIPASAQVDRSDSPGRAAPAAAPAPSSPVPGTAQATAPAAAAAPAPEPPPLPSPVPTAVEAGGGTRLAAAPLAAPARGFTLTHGLDVPVEVTLASSAGAVSPRRAVVDPGIGLTVSVAVHGDVPAAPVVTVRSDVAGVLEVTVAPPAPTGG